jgi:hypothetical protein
MAAATFLARTSFRAWIAKAGTLRPWIENTL